MASDFRNHSGQIVLLHVLHSTPAGKVSHLTIISIVGKVYLRANEENLLIVGNYSAIVADILVAYGPLFQVSEGVSKVITLAGRSM